MIDLINFGAVQIKNLVWCRIINADKYNIFKSISCIYLRSQNGCVPFEVSSQGVIRHVLCKISRFVFSLTSLKAYFSNWTTPFWINYRNNAVTYVQRVEKYKKKLHKYVDIIYMYIYNISTFSFTYKDKKGSAIFVNFCLITPNVSHH